MNGLRVSAHNWATGDAPPGFFRDLDEEEDPVLPPPKPKPPVTSVPSHLLQFMRDMRYVMEERFDAHCELLMQLGESQDELRDALRDGLRMPAPKFETERPWTPFRPPESRSSSRTGTAGVKVAVRPSGEENHDDFSDEGMESCAEMPQLPCQPMNGEGKLLGNGDAILMRPTALAVSSEGDDTSTQYSEEKPRPSITVSTSNVAAQIRGDMSRVTTRKDPRRRRGQIGDCDELVGDDADMNPHIGFIKSIVDHSRFDMFIGILIVANAALIGVQADLSVRGGTDGYTDPPEIRVLEVFFCWAFFAELMVRILVSGSFFFTGDDWKFNWFDTIIVSVAVMEEMFLVVLSSTHFENTSFLRIIRIFKLVRVLRIVRVVRFFRELRMMVISIASCFTSLFWTVFLLWLVMFIFGVGVMTFVAKALEAGTGINEATLELFGTLPRTMLTMFQTITGGVDWGEVTDSLTDLSPISVAMFITYICFVMFAVMNIMTGLFVEQALKAAETDLENTLQEEQAKRELIMANLRAILHEADVSKNGFLTWAQLEDILVAPKVLAYFKSLQLELTDLKSFFDLMSLSGDNPQISIDHFVRGCMRLKGPAKNIDMVVMRHDLETLTLEFRRVHGAKLKKAVTNGGDGSPFGNSARLSNLSQQASFPSM